MSPSKVTVWLAASPLVLWLAASAGCAMMLAAAGLLSLWTIEPHPFPGDPPTLDLILGIACLVWPFILAGLAAAWVGARFLLEQRRVLRIGSRAVAALLALSVVSLVPVMVHIGKRHFGEWGELKSLLGQSESRVLELVRRQGGRLSPSEYEVARAWFQEHPVYFKFGGLPQPVQVRMMSPLPPYVGVDFGKGDNAVFDPDTMICTYSD